MSTDRITAGVFAVVALAWAVGAAAGESPVVFDEDREVPVLVAERSGVASRLTDTWSGAMGIRAGLGLGFGHEPMRPAGAAPRERDPKPPSTVAAEETAAAELRAPLVFAFGPAVPTPFVRTTELTFDLPTTSRVRIESYDVRGREVKAALSEELGPGHHVRAWEAVDGGGRGLTPGIYLLRFEATALDGRGRFRAVRKLLLMH